MTYTAHQETQQTLAILDTLDLDTLDLDKLTEQEIAEKFGWEEDYQKDRLSSWQQMKPKLWLLFDEPYSSFPAKVTTHRSPFPSFPSSRAPLSAMHSVFSTADSA